MTNEKIEELKIVEKKGLQDVKVFRICETDAIAAYSLEEARTFYKKSTGATDEELYDENEVEIIPLETKFWNDEEMSYKKSLQEMLEEGWEGKPQFVICWDV